MVVTPPYLSEREYPAGFRNRAAMVIVEGDSLLLVEWMASWHLPGTQIGRSVGTGRWINGWKAVAR